MAYPDPSAVFPGHPPYLAAACAELGLDLALAPAAALRQPAVASVSTLVAQLQGQPESARADGVRACRVHRDGLAVALRAVERMLALIEPDPPSPPSPPTRSAGKAK